MCKSEVTYSYIVAYLYIFAYMPRLIFMPTPTPNFEKVGETVVCTTRDILLWGSSSIH